MHRLRVTVNNWSSGLAIRFNILHTLGLDWQEIDVYCGSWDRRGDLSDDTVVAPCFQTFIIALQKMCGGQVASCPKFSLNFPRLSIINWHSLTGSGFYF